MANPYRSLQRRADENEIAENVATTLETSDDRPWGGEDPLGVVFTYAPGRSGQHADNILKGLSGTLQVDGYAGYHRLLKRPAQDVTLAYCWANARRKLHDVTQTGAAPIAQEGLAQIQALYRIEKDLRGQTAEQRRTARQERSKPAIDASDVNERFKLTRFQHLNLTHSLWRKAPRRAALI